MSSDDQVLKVRRFGGPEVREYYDCRRMARSVDETVWLGTMMVEQIGKLVTGEASVRKSVGGPVEMVRQASEAARRGLFEYARLMGILSISLGIVNLLPVPVLDGGQLLFFLLEAVRGRPVSVALRRAQQLRRIHGRPHDFRPRHGPPEVVQVVGIAVLGIDTAGPVVGAALSGDQSHGENWSERIVRGADGVLVPAIADRRAGCSER